MQKFGKYFKSPFLEMVIMVGATVISYVALGIIAIAAKTTAAGEMSTRAIVLWLLGFFLLSVAIAAISVVAGIGGGVIFTPLMMAFTNVNDNVIRGTGLIVAMFSGLISTGIFIRKGLGNFRLCMTLNVSQAAGALLGAYLALGLPEVPAVKGGTRIALGVILALVAVYFLFGKSKLDWPEVKKVDWFTKKLNMGYSYFEESENKVRSYILKGAPMGLFFIFIVGLIGGFFGMGGGWAITPVQNLAMAVPLKVAAANSGIILGIGSCVSVWPYIAAGAVIPLFVVPWLSGQVVGGYVGSYALAKIRVGVVRLILIGIMFYTSITLIDKGLFQMKLTPAQIPPLVTLLLFVVISAIVTVAAVKASKNETVEVQHE